MSWHLWRIATRIGDFNVTETQKDQIVGLLDDGADRIDLPNGEMFAAHQFLGVTKTNLEDRDHKPKKLPAPTEPPLTPAQLERGKAALAEIRGRFGKDTRTAKPTKLQAAMKEALKGVDDPEERKRIVAELTEKHKAEGGTNAD